MGYKGGDWEGRGKKPQDYGPSVKRRSFYSGLAGVRKMVNFAIVRKSCFVCLKSVNDQTK